MEIVNTVSEREWTAWVHTSHMSKPVITFVFKVLRNGLLRYILHMSKPVITFVFKVLRNGLLRYILSACPNLWLRSCSKCYGMDSFGTYCTCPNLWLRSCSKCYAMDCFGTYFQHVQTCDNVGVQSATEWTASVHTAHVQTCDYVVFKVLRNLHILHLSKPVITFVFKVLRNGLLRYILSACPNLWLRSCSKCYGMDCFGTYCTCPNLWLRCVQSAAQSTYFTHVQTCDNVLVQSASQWTASVHTLNMSKPVITFVFKLLRIGLLRYIFSACPNLWLRSCSKCFAMDCLGTYFTHVQTCDNVGVQSATQSTAMVHTSHMSKPVIAFVFQVLLNELLRYILYTCPNLW